MKLWFDQNISFRIIRKIEEIFPDSEQVRRLGLENYSDIQIWTFAKENGYSIVTFDSDYFDIASLKGHPPKIVWLRSGNTTTDGISGVLHEKSELIKEFIGNSENRHLACLEIE
ncbi:MAG: DUF5615 family PIN-like protein [Bacteroidia bacterium]|nr:DUF5615 family PIN-like protein [Bacteroidia bacterium]